MTDLDGASRDKVFAELRSAVGLLPYQAAVVSSESRFTWNCWSRQTGKSFTFAMRRLLRGLSRRRNQIILSAGERQSREVMEKVRMHCFGMRIWCEFTGQFLTDDPKIRRLEARLPGNVRIIALPANPLTARGFTGDVFLDEFAMHRDDEAIWAALFPTLLRGEGELDVASTPRGRKNVFYRLKNNERFAHSTVTLEDAVRQGLDVDASAMRVAIGDEQTWRQEFCCQFEDESTSFITYDLIRRCQDERLTADPDWDDLASPNMELYVGVDVGRKRDVTAIWLWHKQVGPPAPPEKRGPAAGEAGDVVLSTIGVLVLQDAPFAEQELQIGRILEHRSVRRCCIDSTGMGLHLAERLVERFGDHRVEPVVFTTGLKSQLAGGLRVLAERGRLRIPADEAIMNDWHSIERTVTAGGHLRFDAYRSTGRAGGGDRGADAGLGAGRAAGPGRAVTRVAGAGAGGTGREWRAGGAIAADRRHRRNRGRAVFRARVWPCLPA